MLFGLHRCLYCGHIPLNTGAQLQFPAQPPQTLGNLSDILGDFLAAPSGPFCVVKPPALVCQGVDLRLERVILHGKLGRCLNVVLHQIGKLLLVTVKLDQFLT